MLFNSISFAVFLPIVFILYWFVTDKNLRFQNSLLLASSYVFYAWWDYRFLFLLIFSTYLGYFTAIKIYSTPKINVKRNWFWLSVFVNVVILGIFKYYNFFAGTFANVISYSGIHINALTLNIILPIGISFYTFHGLSYIIDVYKERISPVRSFIDYAVFVSFFPLLVAGPIERATHLLPQIQKKRQFDYSKAIDGLRQILWGLFKKIVIADGCAEYANMIFNNPVGYSGSTLVFGMFFFAIQIYCDFSGYSDIAIGVARLFGIELLQNFAFPYFSRNIPEFWRRWHISLSTWFRDYIFFPLERRRIKFIGQPLNMLVIFFLTGLWHGANWTFIVWGLLHGLYMILFSFWGRTWARLTQTTFLLRFAGLVRVFETLSTFLLVSFTWIFFRAKDMEQAINYISRLFSSSIIKAPELPGKVWWTIAIIGVFLIIEWFGKDQHYAIARLGLSWPRSLRWALYYAIILTVFYFAGSEQQFIYFQF